MKALQLLEHQNKMKTKIEAALKRRRLDYKGLAKITGLHASALYYMLNKRFNPRLATILKIQGALNIKLIQ